jgi:hypothetical protein
MRVTLKQDWRRWKKGKTLTGGAAREAKAAGADKAKPKPKTDEE